jgi:hypothetical protein
MQGKWALNIEFLEHKNWTSAGSAIFYSCISRAHNDGNLSKSTFATPCSLDKMTRHAKKMYEDYLLNLTNVLQDYINKWTGEVKIRRRWFLNLRISEEISEVFRSMSRLTFKSTVTFRSSISVLPNESPERKYRTEFNPSLKLMPLV